MLFMKTHIAIEIDFFLSEHEDVSVRKLAREAGISPASIFHIRSKRRSDMKSANADKVREAMQRLSKHLPSP